MESDDGKKGDSRSCPRIASLSAGADKKLASFSSFGYKSLRPTTHLSIHLSIPIPKGAGLQRIEAQIF